MKDTKHRQTLELAQRACVFGVICAFLGAWLADGFKTGIMVTLFVLATLSVMVAMGAFIEWWVEHD
jgi:uncharacterized membrane protein YfcA